MDPDPFGALGLDEDDRAAWRAAGSPDLAGWLTDRVARRPEGPRAVAVYGSADIHQSLRRQVLAALELGPADRLLEVGCGGGLLLRSALGAGAAVTGVDHSPAMVELATQRAPGARVVQADAGALPFEDAVFTALASVQVLLFIADLASVLREWTRVLAPGGRLAGYTVGEALRGTPAIPPPLDRTTHLHAPADLASAARGAGLTDVDVADDDGGLLLTAVRPAS